MTSGLLPFRARSLARSRDPETSHHAANAAEDLRNQHARLILRALLSHVEPLAAEQLADLTRLSSVQVCRRLAELADAELIERTSEKHKNRSGRTAFKWRVA